MTLNKKHADILEARGLDVELLVRLGVRSAARGDHIEIPYLENGELVNVKSRTISGPKKFWQQSDARKIFWNVDVLSDQSLADQPLIIVEGELDAVAAIQCGFPRTVSVPDGAPAEKIGSENLSKKYSFLDRSMAHLRDCKTIILAVDGDSAGSNLLHDLALRLGKHKCKWIKYPKGSKDLNDLLQKFGPAMVVTVLNRALWYGRPSVYRLYELPERTASPVYRIGMPLLEEHYGIRLGDFSVLTGIPGHGKSALLNDIMGHLVMNYGWTIAVASFEQDPQTDHKRNLRRWYHRKHPDYQTQEQKQEADDWINRHFAFIVPPDRLPLKDGAEADAEEQDATLPWMIQACAEAVTRHGASMVVIDPWNELDHTRPPDMTMTEYVGFSIKQFRKFAQKYRVHVIVAAHPTKLKPDREGGLPFPTLYDISDSAHWFNKPDVGLVIFRDKQNQTTIRICKARYPEETGERADVSAQFNKSTGRFQIVEPDMKV